MMQGIDDTALAGAFFSLPVKTREAVKAEDPAAMAELDRAYQRFATAQPNRATRRARR